MKRFIKLSRDNLDESAVNRFIYVVVKNTQRCCMTPLNGVQVNIDHSPHLRKHGNFAVVIKSSININSPYYYMMAKICNPTKYKLYCLIE